MNINLSCREVNINVKDKYDVSVFVREADEDEVLDQFHIVKVVQHFGAHELLKTIGVDEAKEYFGLTEKE